MDNSLAGLLGMAARARKITCGDTAILSISEGQAKLVLIAADASDNTRKKVVDKCTFYQVPYLFVNHSIELSQSIGQVNRMYVAILDSGFKKSIEQYLK